MEDYEEYVIAFGQKVRSFRQQKGFSQETLAELSDLDRTYIGGIERGERNPSLKNILKLAYSLGIDPSQLFLGWKDD
jgi:transcriptional regulator with XRE-family HTH domain